MTASPEAPDRQLSRLILTSSSAMIGICTTLIGLVKIMETRSGPSKVDEYGACVMVIFVVVVLLSYLSLRLARLGRVSAMLEGWADGLFILGLICLTCIGLLFGYQII